MNTYDQIIASAYYVFGNQLTSKIVASFLVSSCHNGNQFQKEELRLTQLKDIIIFENHMFRLKEGFSLSDISECINFDMVRFFQNLKNSRDKYYSNYEEKRKVMIKREAFSKNKE